MAGSARSISTVAISRATREGNRIEASTRLAARFGLITAALILPTMARAARRGSVALWDGADARQGQLRACGSPRPGVSAISRTIHGVAWRSPTAAMAFRREVCCQRVSDDSLWADGQGAGARHAPDRVSGCISGGGTLLAFKKMGDGERGCHPPPRCFRYRTRPGLRPWPCAVERGVELVSTGGGGGTAKPCATPASRCATFPSTASQMI